MSRSRLTDLIGTPSLECGNVYIKSIIDTNCYFVVNGFMKKKSYIHALKKFWVDTCITPIYSEKTQAFLLNHGIYSMLRCPYTPQHNCIKSYFRNSVTEGVS